ncbi:GSCOCG00005544001-RA-CDS [Cotesia congregata]|nr:GSCOCG00005544001-RA-CDS [Cotesia congregata]
MMTKCLILFFALVAACSAGIIAPAVPAALTVGTYASSYNAHAINHAYAAPYVAAAAPLAAAPLTYSAYPAAYSALPAHTLHHTLQHTPHTQHPSSHAVNDLLFDIYNLFDISH